MSRYAQRDLRHSPAQSRAVMRWFNGWTMNRIRRRKGGKVMGMDALVLTTVGRKSGGRAPVAYFPDGNDAWLVVASAKRSCVPATSPPSDQVKVERLPSVDSSRAGARTGGRGRIQNELPGFSRSTNRKPTASCMIRLHARSPSTT